MTEASLLDALEVLDAIEDMLFEAKGVPISGRARVDPETLAEMVRRLRGHLEITLHGFPAPRIRAALQGLDDKVREAKPMRLYRGVSVDKQRIYDLLDEIRQNVVEELRPLGAERPPVPEHLLALDELDDLVSDGPTVPMTDEVRIDPIAFRAALNRLGASGLPPAALPLLDQLTAVFEAAKGVPLSPYVRCDREELMELIDLIRATRG